MSNQHLHRDAPTKPVPRTPSFGRGQKTLSRPNDPRPLRHPSSPSSSSEQEISSRFDVTILTDKRPMAKSHKTRDTSTRPALPLDPSSTAPFLESQNHGVIASGQTRTTYLPSKESQEQEAWANEQVIHSETCVAGCGWNRYDNEVLGIHGWMCECTFHLFTDELLAEGKGGYYESRERRSS
jgi:hypothetical protein